MAAHQQDTTRRGTRAFPALQQLWTTEATTISSKTPPTIPQTDPSHLTTSTTTPSKTILYLAYGSNLCSETFRGSRGIKPLSSINVHVPSLNLTFDLAGIPYTEPCFANTQYEHPSKPTLPPPSSTDYHKDRWKKGLIGVVYEVTPEDYRTIIATEGGGASYQDVVVDCYALPKDTKTVNPHPSGPTFKAHTLLAPRSPTQTQILNSINGRAPIQRPDPSYAQASARYLKLITDGAEEHSLPEEYTHYLYNIRPYTITTYRQRVGQVLFLGFWAPLVMASLGLGKVFAGKDGRIPSWLAKLIGILFTLMWCTYDRGFKRVFGDGERTEYKEDGGQSSVQSAVDLEKGCWLGKWGCEKNVRLEEKEVDGK